MVMWTTPTRRLLPSSQHMPGAAPAWSHRLAARPCLPLPVCFKLHMAMLTCVGSPLQQILSWLQGHGKLPGLPVAAPRSILSPWAEPLSAAGVWQTA